MRFFEGFFIEKNLRKKMSSQQAQQAIIDYLVKTNRPYSLLEISNNIKLDIAKTAASL